MTYTPPEGVAIGNFTTDTLPASFRAPADAVISYKIYGTSGGAGVETESGEPAGYKIPISLESGITENLFDPDNAEFVYGFFGAGSPISDSNSNTRTSFISCEPNTTYTVCKTLSARFSVAWSESKPANGVAIYGNVYENDATNITITTGATAQYLVFYYFHALYDTLTEQEIRDSIMVIKGSTAPDHYIPHRYESNYDLMIGSTKLEAEEYVDYAEQKIYKMSGSTLVPTDPPVPLPAIQTYQGENTLSSTETLGEVELTGDWLAIMGSTQADSIDIGFTVDADEFIAFATVDDGPSIQVSETITMPTSADSFTLDVVSWGRERYTETVYSALSLDDLTLTPQT